MELEEVKKMTKLKVAIQINGKTKDVIEVDENISKDKVLEIVMTITKL